MLSVLRVCRLKKAFLPRICSCPLSTTGSETTWQPSGPNVFAGVIGKDYVVKCPYPEASIPRTSLYSHVFDRFGKFGGEVALIDGVTGREVTYSQLEDEVARVSSGLRGMGLRRGDVLAIVSSNSLQYVSLFFSTLAAGGVVTTCNPAYTADEICFQLKNSNAKFVSTTVALLPTIQEAVRDLPVEKIIVMDEGGQTTERVLSLETLLQDSGSLFNVEDVDSMEDIAVLPYSSGTTGLAKGVMLTHHNIVSNICQQQHPEFMGRVTGRTAMGILPFFHIYGMVVIMFTGLYSRSPLVVMPKFEPMSFLTAIEKHKIQLANLVPPLVLFLAKHPEVSNYDCSSLEDVLSGAAPLGGDIVREACKRTGIKRVQQLYGLTETGPVSHTMPCSMGMSKPDSVGLPLLNVETKFVDPNTGAALGPNCEGEVLIRGPNIMKGYLNNPDATKECITTDGWFHTADIGYYDDEGHAYITDRLKELIKVKGFQVAPAELEALLQHHPKINDAAVIGIPNERLGEAPKAFVVKGDPSLSKDEVQKYIEQKVTQHKWLVGGVEFIDQVPKSPSGKILRRTLRNL